jgi:hypothetical protein
MGGAIPPLSNTPSWRGAQLKHRDNFTFTFTLTTTTIIIIIIKNNHDCLSTRSKILLMLNKLWPFSMTRCNNNNDNNYIYNKLHMAGRITRMGK